MVRFRLLKEENIPWSQLDAFPDRVVFQTREWLHFLAETQKGKITVAEIYRDGERVGYFSGLLIKKLGLSMLGSSFPGWTTPYIGFNLIPGCSRLELLPHLSRWIFDELGCLHWEVSDWGFRQESGLIEGITATAYESFASDLSKSEEQILAGMDKGRRRYIRRAAEYGVCIQHATDMEFADEYYEQLKEVFAKQGKVPTYGVERVRSLMRHLLPTGRLLLLRAFNPEGQCIATGLYPGMNKTAYFWGNASWRQGLRYHPNEAMHWYAMRYWKNQGAEVFDWGGGGEYKAKYGAPPISLPWFYKSKYRVLSLARERALALFYRSQRLIGRLKGVGGPAGAGGA